MKNKGIVERMKAADSLDKAVKLTEEAEGYEAARATRRRMATPFYQ